MRKRKGRRRAATGEAVAVDAAGFGLDYRDVAVFRRLSTHELAGLNQKRTKWPEDVSVVEGESEA